jgi:hypothetical protein
MTASIKTPAIEANAEPTEGPSMTPQHAITTPEHRAPLCAAVVTRTAENKNTVYLDRDRAHDVGGSRSDDFNTAILRRTMDAIYTPPSAGVNGEIETINAAMAALAAFKPTDEIEGMIASQAVAMHHAAMECFRRAMLAGQSFDVGSKFRRDGANLARGMTDMLDALDRKRGKGPQVVRVERVTVHDGGQAIVGNVTPSAAGRGA